MADEPLVIEPTGFHRLFIDSVKYLSVLYLDIKGIPLWRQQSIQSLTQ